MENDKKQQQWPAGTLQCFRCVGGIPHTLLEHHLGVREFLDRNLVDGEEHRVSEFDCPISSRGQGRGLTVGALLRLIPGN